MSATQAGQTNGPVDELSPDELAPDDPELVDSSVAESPAVESSGVAPQAESRRTRGRVRMVRCL